jgi:hypothetical protein
MEHRAKSPARSVVGNYTILSESTGRSHTGKSFIVSDIAYHFTLLIFGADPVAGPVG